MSFRSFYLKFFRDIVVLVSEYNHQALLRRNQRHFFLFVFFFFDLKKVYLDFIYLSFLCQIIQLLSISQSPSSPIAETQTLKNRFHQRFFLVLKGFGLVEHNNLSNSSALFLIWSMVAYYTLLSIFLFVIIHKI